MVRLRNSREVEVELVLESAGDYGKVVDERTVVRSDISKCTYLVNRKEWITDWMLWMDSDGVAKGNVMAEERETRKMRWGMSGGYLTSRCTCGIYREFALGGAGRWAGWGYSGALGVGAVRGC